MWTITAGYRIVTVHKMALVGKQLTRSVYGIQHNQHKYPNPFSHFNTQLYNTQYLTHLIRRAG